MMMICQRVYRDLEMRLTVREFVDSDSQVETFENITDEMIVAAIAPSHDQDDNTIIDNPDSEAEPELVPTPAEAKTAIQYVIRFFESRNSTTEDDMIRLFSIKSQIEHETVK